MRSGTHWQWHLDEVFVKINGEEHYLWRAVDHEGEVLESFVTKRRDRKSALKFLRKTMKRHGSPQIFVTDKLRSYGVAMKVIGSADKQETGRWLNNQAENSHQPFRRRERAMIRFSACEPCRDSLLSTLPFTTISIKIEASPNAITSRPTAPPHSPSGAAFVRHKRAGALA